MPSVTFACIKGIGETFDRTVQSKQRQLNGEKQRTSKDFWRHVRHTSSYAGVQSAFRVVDSNVEIGEVDVSMSVQQYIVWLDVAAR
jgi:hypothetical protein